MKNKPKRECRAVQEQLRAYLEGPLDAEDTLRIRGHLKDCAACREALAFEEVLLRSAEAYPTLSVPEGFAGEVMERWAAERAWVEVGDEWVIHSLWDLPQMVIRILATHLRWTGHGLRAGLTFGRHRIVTALSYAEERLRFEMRCAVQTTITALKSAYGLYIS